jgi:hypothetical protein
MLFSASRRNRRTFCSKDCQNLDYILRGKRTMAEFEWIAGTDTWDNVATRLGFRNRQALEKWLERRGEHEWVSKVHSTGMPPIHQRAA